MPPCPLSSLNLTRTVALTLILGLGAGLLSCGGKKESPDEARARAVDAKAEEAIATYADLVEATYRETWERAKAMDASIEAFTAAPSEELLATAKTRWTEAREAYQQSEVFRFYGGPIDAPDTGPEGDLNAWPLDEAYIDYVVENPQAGIVQNADSHPMLSEEHLRSLNGKGSEENVATGWHAVEFFLWGQDLDDEGPGRRSHRDFIDGGKAHADRRRAYLRLVSKMIVADLQSLVDAWDSAADASEQSGSYRRAFLKGDARATLSKILTGVGTLAVGELRGERIVTPFLTKQQENEHSCFSDQTHLDHLNNAIGIRNVWRGEFLGRDLGPGVAAVLKVEDEKLASQVEGAIEASVAVFQNEAINPFDRAIASSDGSAPRQALQQSLDALEMLDQRLTRMAKRMNLEIVTRLPG